jgi:hypothetical protein
MRASIPRRRGGCRCEPRAGFCSHPTRRKPKVRSRVSGRRLTSQACRKPRHRRRSLHAAPPALRSCLFPTRNVAMAEPALCRSFVLGRSQVQPRRRYNTSRMGMGTPSSHNRIQPMRPLARAREEIRSRMVKPPQRGTPRFTVSANGVPKDPCSTAHRTSGSRVAARRHPEGESHVIRRASLRGARVCADYDSGNGDRDHHDRCEGERGVERKRGTTSGAAVVRPRPEGSERNRACAPISAEPTLLGRPH